MNGHTQTPSTPQQRVGYLQVENITCVLRPNNPVNFNFKIINYKNKDYFIRQNDHLYIIMRVTKVY